MQALQSPRLRGKQARMWAMRTIRSKLCTVSLSYLRARPVPGLAASDFRVIELRSRTPLSGEASGPPPPMPPSTCFDRDNGSLLYSMAFMQVIIERCCVRRIKNRTDHAQPHYVLVDRLGGGRGHSRHAATPLRRLHEHLKGQQSSSESPFRARKTLRTASTRLCSASPNSLPKVKGKHIRPTPASIYAQVWPCNSSAPYFTNHV